MGGDLRCDGRYQPSSVTEALDMLDPTLDFLSGADAVSAGRPDIL